MIGLLHFSPRHNLIVAGSLVKRSSLVDDSAAERAGRALYARFRKVDRSKFAPAIVATNSLRYAKRSGEYCACRMKQVVGVLKIAGVLQITCRALYQSVVDLWSQI